MTIDMQTLVSLIKREAARLDADPHATRARSDAPLTKVATRHPEGAKFTRRQQRRARDRHHELSLAAARTDTPLSCANVHPRRNRGA